MVKKELDPWTDRVFEQRTRETAYFLWEQDGKPEGKEKDYWFAALERGLRERECDRQLARVGEPAKPFP